MKLLNGNSRNINNVSINNRNEMEKEKESKFGLSKATAFGLAAVMLTSFFITGCGAKPGKVDGKPGDQPPVQQVVQQVDKDGQGGQGESVDDVKNVEDEQEVLEYLEFDAEDILEHALKVDTKGMYLNLDVTNKKLGNSTIYQDRINVNDFYIVSGNERFKVEANKEGNGVRLEDGLYKLSKEGFKSSLTLRVGTEKDNYLKLQEDAKKINLAAIKEPIMFYDGINFKDDGTLPMVRLNQNGELMVNLSRLAHFLELEYTDSAVADVTEESKLEDNKKNHESITLEGFGGSIKYTFMKNSNKCVVSSEKVDNYIKKLEEVMGKDKVPTQYLNVGEKKLEHNGTTTWIPVEYLRTAFGIEYEVSGEGSKSVITLKEGLLLPTSELLDVAGAAEVEESKNLNDTKVEGTQGPNAIVGEVDTNNGSEKDQSVNETQNGGGGKAEAKPDGSPVEEKPAPEKPEVKPEVKPEKPQKVEKPAKPEGTTPKIPGMVENEENPFKGESGGVHEGVKPNGSTHSNVQLK